MRFYDVKDGSISVDGSEIRSVTRESLRRQYGMVLQDTWLKTASVRENIRLAKPDATDAEVEAAARMAHADPLSAVCRRAMTRCCPTRAARCPPDSGSCCALRA